MIKLSQALPEIIPDGTNAQAMTDFLIAIKQCIDELSRKAQSLQLEERNTAPSPSDIEEGEFVRATVGGLNYIYTKKGGTILRFQIS